MVLFLPVNNRITGYFLVRKIGVRKSKLAKYDINFVSSQTYIHDATFHHSPFVEHHSCDKKVLEKQIKGLKVQNCTFLTLLIKLKVMS